MPSFSLAYRLRIRNASTLANPNGTADALTLTSVRGGTNPYLVDAPTGDGQSFDPLTGEFVAGSYTVLVADPVTGSDGTGTLRLITNALEDAAFRQQLLSRRAYLELSEDGGGTWPRVLVAGYVNSLKLVDAITWSFAIGDARRIEQQHKVFSWSNVPGPLGISERAVFPRRGCLIGGPIIGGLGSLADPGGWEFTVSTSEADPSDATLTFVKLALVAGYAPPFFRRTRTARDLDEFADDVLAGYRESYTGLTGFAAAFDPLAIEYAWHPALTVLLSQGSTQWVGTLFAFGNGVWFVRLDVASSVTPPTGKVRLRILTTEVSERSPLYVDLHPIALVTALYDTVGIAWDATTAASVTAAIGGGLRYALRITAPVRMGEFLSSAVFGPFGFGVRNGADGEREFFLTRRMGTAAPATTIATDHVPDAEIPPVFELDERTIVTAFRISYRTLSAVNTPSPIRTARRRGTWPPDGIDSREVTVLSENADVSVFSTREIEYDLPGMVHDVQSFSPAMAPLIAAITQEGFDRYGRGAIGGETIVLRGTSAATASVGDEVNVDLAHLPSRGYRLGESTVPARIMQILQRTELPEGAAFTLRDAGVDQQPVSPAATITAAASGGNTRTLAKFTVTNAAAINTAAVLTTVIEWATGASAPSGNGNVYARYAPGTVPTGGIALPPVAPGTTVHVRARTEQPFRRASAWTAWSAVTLTAFSPPTAVADSALTAESVVITWTVAAGGFPINVYLYQGAAAPGSGTAADWAPYLVAQLPGTSTRTLLRGLTAALAYTVGVAHVDPGTGAVTTVATDGFTTTTNVATASALQGIAQIPTAEDAGYRTGVALALYASNDQYDLVLERAPDAAGVPGTWAALVRLPGGTSVYVDELPSNGATWWYRARHETPGLLVSAWTPNRAAIAGGVPDVLVRPIPFPATLDVSSTLDATSAVITWAGTAVELKINTGAWAAPSASPITVARGVIGGLDVPYTFRSTGLLGDVVTVTVIVPAVIVATLTLAISACIVTNAGAAPPPYNRLEVPFTYTGMPAGTVFDVAYNNGVSGGVDSSSGVAMSTSPQTVTFNTVTFAGSPGAGAVTVTAKLNGQVIATAVRNKVYVV